MNPKDDRNPSPPNEEPAGLEVEYNHDLDVSEAFLAAHPLLRTALKDERLLKAFGFFDSQAKAHKRSFHQLGSASLVVGLIPLFLAAIRLAIGETAFGHFATAGIAADLCGVASVCFVLWNRKKRHRVLWCQAVFCRERLRQWHFQKFLDGEFIGMLANHKWEYEKELNRRWGELQQNLHDGYGMMAEFMRFASRGGDYFHKPTDYADEILARQVVDVLWTLRFEHQLRFSRRKIEPEGEQAGLALEERTTLSETVASASLGGAILVSALAVFISGSQLFNVAHRLPFEAQVATRILAGSALLLAVLSAASRAYRAGYTLPDESESYEEYCDRITELKAVFRSANATSEKLRELGHLEEESCAELRRFLRMKTRATFVS